MAISREVFNHSDFVVQNDMAADRDVSRNLTRLGQILEQASLALKEKPIPINQGDQCDGYLEDAGELCDDSIEHRLGFGIEQRQLGERGKALGLIIRYGITCLNWRCCGKRCPNGRKMICYNHRVHSARFCFYEIEHKG